MKFMLLILLIAVPAYATLSWYRPKYARSEVAYAEQSREMMVAQDYITPLYHWMPCIDKPVMIYWMIIPGFKLLGLSGFAARLSSILAGTACLVLLGSFVRRLFDWKTALMATMLLASANRFIEFSSLCMTDIFLTLFDSITLFSLYFAISGARRPGLLYALAALSTGLAVLTKGPVGLVLPGACIALWALACGQWKAIKARYLLVWLTIFLLVAAPWYIFAVYKVQGPQYFWAWFYKHNVERFVGSYYDYHYPPYYMLASFFLGFAPWSLLVPFALIDSFKKWKSRQNLEQSRLELLLWTWMVSTTLFFTASHGKMNYYDLPAFPAAATLVAIYLTQWLQEKRTKANLFAWTYTALLFVCAFAAVVLLPHIGPNLVVADWIFIPLCLFVPAVAAAFYLVKGKTMIVYPLTAAAICLCVCACSVQALPIIRRQIPALDYIETIDRTRPDATIAFHSDFAKTVDWVDQTLIMTWTKSPPVLHNIPEIMGFNHSCRGEIFIIIPANRFEELPPEYKAQFKIIASRPYIGEKPDTAAVLRQGGVITEPVPLLLVARNR